MTAIIVNVIIIMIYNDYLFGLWQQGSQCALVYGQHHSVILGGTKGHILCDFYIVIIIFLRLIYCTLFKYLFFIFFIKNAFYKINF